MLREKFKNRQRVSSRFKESILVGLPCKKGLKDLYIESQSILRLSSFQTWTKKYVTEVRL